MSCIFDVLGLYALLIARCHL